MKIKQAEELVGITSKNIRFYEEEGLINPRRSENGYRDYSMENINTLKQIKLLRKFRVPVEEIKNVIEEKKTLEECLEGRIHSLEMEQRNLKNMSALVSTILEQSTSMDSLDAEVWLEEIDKMETEGADFVDLKKEDIHKKKKTGAVAGGLFMIAVMVLLMGAYIWGFLTEDMPVKVFVFMTAIPVIIIVCIVVVLRKRLKEIEGGEEDEAAKY